MSAGVGVVDGTVIDVDTDSPSYTILMGCVGLYGAMIVIGLLAVTMFIIAQISGMNTFSQWPFFKIVRQLTFANAIFLLIQATNIFPSMLIEVPENTTWVENTWFKAGEIVTEFGDQAVLYFTLLMGLNRAAVFVIPSTRLLFEGKPLRIIILAVWILIGGITTIRLTMYPSKRFNKKTLTFAAILLEPNSSWIYQATTIAGYVIPLALIALYLLIFFFVRRKRAASRRAAAAVSVEMTPIRDTTADDIQILVQAVVVSLTLEITRLISTIAPMMHLDDTTQWILNILASSSSVINHATNPLIFILTNKAVRNAIRRIPRKIMGHSSTNGAKVGTQ